MTIAPRKEDRRKERTRQLLRDALLELIVEKGYDAISIQDITDRANVARPTFYLHFTDKEELLFSSLRDIYDGLVSSHLAMSREDRADKMLSPDKADTSDFHHVAEYADFYRVMLSKKGSIAFLFQVLEYLQHIYGSEMLECLAVPTAQVRLPEDFVGSFFAGAQIGVTYWWMKQHPEYTPEQVALMMHQLSLPAMKWAANLDGVEEK